MQHIDSMPFETSSFFLMRTELSLRNFLTETRQSAATKVSQFIWWIIVLAVIVIILLLSPFWLPFYVYLKITQKKRIEQINNKKPVFLKRIGNMGLEELRIIEADLLAMKEVLDIFSDGEGGYLTERKREKEFYLIVELVNESLSAVKKRKTINLGSAISDDELDEYAKRISPLRDLWDNE